MQSKDIDVKQTHDGFFLLPILDLEGLGFCEPRGVVFIANWRTSLVKPFV